MISKIFILVGLFCYMNLESAGQCPTERLIVEKINYFKDPKVPVKERIKELESYLDTIKTCSYRNDSIHANLFRTLGGLYYREGDFFNAAKCFRESLELLEPIAANSDQHSINRTNLLSGYLWLSIFYDSLHNVPKKMAVIDSCIMAARRFNALSDISAVKALLLKTEHFFDIGDYHSCIEYADLCKKFAWQAVDAYKAQPIYYDNVRKIALSSIGWHVEALLKLKDYKQAEQLIKDNFQVIQKANLNDFFGMIYDQLAQVEINKGDREQAVHLLELALKKHELAGDYFNCKQVSKNIGDNYFRILRDDKNALRYYQKALDYKNKKGNLQHKDSMESLAIFGRIANVYVNKNRFDLSDQYFQLAFDNFKKGSNENFIFQVPSAEVKGIKKVDYLAVLLLDRADAYKKQYLATKNPDFLARGIKAYKIADRFLDTIKIALTDLRSKLFWRSSAKRLYENAIGACYLQKNLNDAFYFFEKSRAVLLNDQLNEQRWINEEDILKETQLKKKIQQLEGELHNSEPSSKRYSDLQDELLNSKQTLEQLRDIIKTTNPLYYQSFVEKKFITIEDVRQKILKDHQALVEIFAGDSAVYSLIVTAGKTFLQRINKPIFDSLSTVYSRAISDPEWLNKNFTSFSQTSHQLYRLLFNAIDLPQGRIIISPDGQYFPFEALLTDSKSNNYFVYDHAVSYTYSARYLLNEFSQNNSSASRNFLGVAPVEYANGLRALMGSDKSLNRMQNYFSNATRLVWNNASKNNFLNQFSNYRIIQLYTHATDSGYNGQPLIYFSDTTLSLSDLFYSKKPATSLIVLSACETALGELHSGEGVFSFNRGFAALGIPSAVSNLWEVDNLATYKLTELFYKYVSDGIPLDIALQKAKKEFITTSVSGESKLPYYWAASILVGKSDKIKLQKRFPWKWVTASVILLILGFLGWIKRGTYNPTRDKERIAA
jgi:CHAT domain-containing protein/tetratricopeptide (TPR) repeat protein